MVHFLLKGAPSPATALTQRDHLMNEDKSAMRPGSQEYHQFYQGYIASVPDGPITTTLSRQPDELRAILSGVPSHLEQHRYAPGKWSIREVVGHVTDAERMYSSRAFAFARRDPSHLPPFDQETYLNESGADGRSLAELVDELSAVRTATLALFFGLSTDAWDRRGVANECEFSVRSLAWIIAGHCQHHIRVLSTRYGIETSI